MMKQTKILVFGDVVGNLGCALFRKYAQVLKKQYSANFVVVNGENSNSTGRGITPRLVEFFKEHDADVITSGNHIWACKEIEEFLTTNDDLIRPANFPSGCPGKGVKIVHKDGVSLAVVNLQGRIFMREILDCPFRAADSLLSYLRDKSDLILLDFHAETTSEKMGMALHLDGKVTAVVGTHTHIQTADERVLPAGTAFITDLGMAGALNGMIGMRKESLLRQFLTQMPQKFVVDQTPPGVISGVCITADAQTGLATGIERFRVIDNDLTC